MIFGINSMVPTFPTHKYLENSDLGLFVGSILGSSGVDVKKL